jgi:hypothetical protein
MNLMPKREAGAIPRQKADASLAPADPDAYGKNEDLD